MAREQDYSLPQSSRNNQATPNHSSHLPPRPQTHSRDHSTQSLSSSSIKHPIENVPDDSIDSNIKIRLLEYMRQSQSTQKSNELGGQENG
jgi:hypothetical protein